MEYPVIVEKNNGVYRALIPTLAHLSAEGLSPDEAVQKVREAAEAYLATVELRTIDIRAPKIPPQPYSTAQDWLVALKVFEGDESALNEHFVEIEDERKRKLHQQNPQGPE